MQFPANLNFNLHGGYDMGLYFAHGRWYNQDTGTWLSPNEKGDYLYGGDGQDPVNRAGVTAVYQKLGQAQQNQHGRYIYTNSGAIIDVTHFDIIGAARVIHQVSLGQSVTIGPNNLCFDPCGHLANIQVDYRLNQPITDKYGTALAIWMDYEIKFETAQPTIPVQTTWVVGGASNFAIEDLPTDYLAFWAAARADATGIEINEATTNSLLMEIADMLGGIRERSDNDPPHCPGNNAGCASQNTQFTPRVQQVEVLHQYWGICPLCIDVPSTRMNYSNKPWPDNLTMINGKPLKPVNDGSWQVERCTVNGILAHPEACNVGWGR